MKEIRLTQNKVTQVDDEDYHNLISNYGKWFYSNGYARCKLNSQSLAMHRVIWESNYGIIPDGIFIDHINRQPLNNQKSNLRLATPQENARNASPQKNNRQLLKNVKYDPRHGRYQAAIRVGGKFIHGAMFDNVRDAGIACDLLAEDYFGDFAYLNSPNASQEDRDRIRKWMNDPKNRSGLSRFRGVTKDPKCDFLWITYSYESQVKNVGRFYAEEDAAILADYFAIKNRGDKAVLNFPNIDKQEYDRVLKIRRSIKKSTPTTSTFRGVVHRKAQNKWEVTLRDNGKYIYGGRFDSENDAALAYNLLLSEYNLDSFPNSVDVSEEDVIRVKELLIKNREPKYTSKYRGVMFISQCKKWHARITINGKGIHIGTFENEIDAALAYNEKALELLGDKAKLNILP